ncbi:hypothetical protein [Foetidibacter luteolus]|uniref:hypothetical protein n=1 Tax=Foetidibacter luteolus TaxID=2608880 RepID=UPI00129A45DC|nr:hypothetical protein [Foetidibacter luteolus]
MKLNFTIALLAVAVQLAAQSIPITDTALPGTVFQLKKEPRFYLNYHGGYGMAIGSSYGYFPDNINSVSVRQIEGNEPVKSTTYRENTKGLGTGFRLGIGAYYAVNDFINVGLDVDYFQSSITKTKDSSFYMITTTEGMVMEQQFNGRSTNTYNARVFTLSPGIIFKAITRPGWYLYNKIGVTAAFGMKVKQTERENNSMQMGIDGSFKDSAAAISKEYKYSINSPAMGFNAGLGAQFKLFERARCFAELQFSHVLFYPEKRSATSYIVNGSDRLGSLPTALREVEFEKGYTDNGVIDPNQPIKMVRQKVPITYLGLVAGIAYRF